MSRTVGKERTGIIKQKAVKDISWRGSGGIRNGGGKNGGIK